MINYPIIININGQDTVIQNYKQHHKLIQKLFKENLFTTVKWQDVEYKRKFD